MSKSDIEFKLIDISSSYDPASDYFTLQADIKPLSYENIYILSSKILSYQDDVLINASDNTLMLFENKDDVCRIYDGISENGNINPNKFDVIYRIFSLIEKNTLNLKLPGPPELSRKGGSFIVHQPETSFIGLNKWKFGSISIKSVVIRKLKDSFEISFNLENKNFLTSIPIIEIKGKNWTQRTEPMLAENSKLKVSLNIYEETDSSDLDFNFMFFDASKSERLSDQIMPEPEIEDTNNVNNEEIQDEIGDEVVLLQDDNEIQTQDIQKTEKGKSMSKFSLNELRSEIDEESYLNFSCDFEVQNLKEKKSFCEYQLILLQGEDKNTPLSNCNVMYTGRSEKCVLNQSNNELYLSCNVKINGTLTPNKFLLRYRFFDEVGSFKFSPKLPNKKEPVVFNLPDKSVDGENKWGGKGIEIKSMRIKIDDGDRHNDSYFNYNYNLICNKLNSFGLNFSWMTSSYPDESDDFEILQHEYSTFRGDFKSSKDVKVLCRIFQASEWKEYSDNNIFTTDS